MGKKFLNTSNKKILFGSGNSIGPGEVIELDDATVKERSQGIKNLIEAGDIVEGTKDKAAEKKAKAEAKAKAESEKEEDPEDEEPEEPEENPKGKKK